MRRATFLAALLFAALAAAPAHAATLRATTDPGVTVARTSAGTYAVAFTASAYRPFAGRRVTITCTSAAARLPAAAPPREYVSRVRAAQQLSTIRLRPARGVDLCALETTKTTRPVLIALDAPARRYLADLDAATAVQSTVEALARLGATHASWPSRGEIPERARRDLVALSRPTERPPAQRLGYYTDGRRHMAVSALSATGRRVFFEMNEDVGTTNLIGIGNVLQTGTRSPSGTLPVGPLPPAGTPLPAATVEGVTATQSGGEIDVSFTGDTATQLYGQQLAGHTVVVECTQTATPILGIVLDSGTSAFTVPAAAGANALKVDLTQGGRGAARFDVCSLSTAPGAPAVQVAVGEGGLAPLEEGLTAQALEVVARRAAGSGTSGYAAAPALASSLSDAVVVLNSPGETPSDRRVGAFSDGRTHLAVVAQAMTGRRFFAEFTGSVIRTNLLQVTDLLPTS